MQKLWQKFSCGITKSIASLKRNVWEVLVLALILVSLSFWVSQKEGYHMDELLSFELSNAKYTPWIVPTQPEGRLAKLMREEVEDDSLTVMVGNVMTLLQDYFTNGANSTLANFKADVSEEPVWISRGQFQDYVTTGAGDRFQYQSVYFNVKDDNHPPLHFMLLHTLSSVFPGQIAPWMGCIINMGCILGCCILLMKMGMLLFQSRAYGVLAAVLYGFSFGAISTTLLIRMYGMITLFCVWELYLHLQKWKSGEWQKHNGILILVTLFGFWTQYFFLFYMIGLALVTMVALWLKKQYKECFSYLRTMVIAAVIGLVCFPFAISDVFSSGRGVEALESLSKGFLGYGSRLVAFGTILAQSIPGMLLVLVVALAYGIYGKKFRQRGPWQVQEICLLVLPPLFYFLLAARMSPYMVDRYIMPIFPVCALLVAGVCWRLELPQRLALLLAGIVAVLGVFLYNGEYCFAGYQDQVAIAKEYREYPCVCIYEGYGFYKNLIEFMEYEDTLLVKPGELENRTTDAYLEQQEYMVVMVKIDVDKAQMAELLLNKYHYEIEEVLLDEGVHGDSLWLCRKEQEGVK